MSAEQATAERPSAERPSAEQLSAEQVLARSGEQQRVATSPHGSAPPVAVAPHLAPPHKQTMTLQRSIGNRTVTALLTAPTPPAARTAHRSPARDGDDDRATTEPLSAGLTQTGARLLAGDPSGDPRAGTDHAALQRRSDAVVQRGPDDKKPAVGVGTRFTVKLTFDMPWKDGEFAKFKYVKFKKTDLTVEGYVDVGEKGFVEVRPGAQVGQVKNIGVKLDDKFWEAKAKDELGQPSIKLKGGGELTTAKAEVSAAVEATWGPATVEGKLIIGGLDWKYETLEKNGGLPKASMMNLKISGGGQLNTQWDLGNNVVAKPNLKIALGAEFEPNWAMILKDLAEKFGKDILRSALRGIITAGAGELLIAGGFALGGVSAIAATLKSLSEWDDMKAIAAQARTACDEYRFGYLDAFGIKKGGAGAGPTSTFSNGYTAGAAAISGAVGKIQAHPAFTAFNFTPAELTEAIKQAAKAYENQIGLQVAAETERPIKEEFVKAWRAETDSHWYNRAMGVGEKNEKYLRHYMGL